MNNKRLNTRKLAACAMLIALSAAGSLIGVPGTSIAFDSLPAFLGALALGAPAGMLVGFAGHWLTAYIHGFPYTVPVHAIISVFMAVTMLAFYAADRLLKRLGANVVLRGVCACAAGVIFNAPLELLAVSPILGLAVCLGLMLPLSAVALANAAGGYIIFAILVKTKVLGVFGASNEL